MHYVSLNYVMRDFLHEGYVSSMFLLAGSRNLQEVGSVTVSTKISSSIGHIIAILIVTPYDVVLYLFLGYMPFHLSDFDRTLSLSLDTPVKLAP